MEKVKEPVEKIITDLYAMRQKITATGEEIGEDRQQKLINRLTCTMKSYINNYSNKEKS